MNPELTETKGVTNATVAVGITLTCVLIITSFLFLMYIQNQIKQNQDILHNYQEKAAYKYSEMKSQRDQLKQICDTNALIDSRKEEWIRQNSKLKLPPELSGQRPCQVVARQETEDGGN